jgi:hypothetical protein
VEDDPEINTASIASFVGVVVASFERFSFQPGV